jgi:hypothetical protein
MSDRGDNANKCFVCSYTFDGHKWGAEVWASTFEEAEMKLRAMASGTVDGILRGVIPAARKCPTCKRDWEGSCD